MEKESKNKLSLLSIFLLKLGGQNLYEDNIWTKFMTGLTNLTISSVLILGLVQLFRKEVSIDSVVESFELAGPYIQTLTKMVILKLSMRVLRTILSEMDEQFWPSDKFGDGLKIKHEKLIKFCVIWYSIILISFEFTVIFMLMKTLLSEQRITPFTVYEITSYDNTYYYCFIYIFQGINMYVGPFIVVGYDVLFADLIVRIIFQMQLLNQGIKSLKLDEIETKEEESERFETLKDYIKHHNLLLRMLDDIKSIFSFILLYKIVAIIVSLCIGLYSILIAKYNDLPE